MHAARTRALQGLHELMEQIAGSGANARQLMSMGLTAAPSLQEAGQ